MKKLYKVIILITTILFFIVTIGIVAYDNALADICIISMVNIISGFFTGVCICLIIYYPKTKDFYSLIFTTFLTAIAIIFLAIGMVVDKRPNYFLFIWCILTIISAIMAFLNLKNMKK